MKRIAYFDNIKGFLIIFIILAHVLSLCSKYYNYSDDFFKFCSLFMLQCFFFISAFFASTSKTSRKKRILKLLKLYLIWQTIITIYYSFILQITSFSLNYLIPRYTLWFLITSIFYTTSEFILKKTSYKLMLPLSIAIGLFSGFLPINCEILSLSRTLVFFPFYVLGYYARELNILSLISNNKIKILSIILSIIILFILLRYNNLLPTKIVKGKYNYYAISSNIFLAFGQRFLFYLLSIIVCCAFLNIIPKTTTIFTQLGRKTLYIYLTQGMILKTFISQKILLNNEVIGTLILLITTIILTIIITEIIKKLKEIKYNHMEVIHGQ